MLILPQRCYRGRGDCEPLHAIEATSEDLTLDQFESPDFIPKSFVCCGINHSETREVKQDCYRLCFKNEETDQITDNDLQDLAHVAAVIAQAIAVTATRMVNGGTVAVPTMQGDNPTAEPIE